jgi:hypothetical protein
LSAKGGGALGPEWRLARFAAGTEAKRSAERGRGERLAAEVDWDRLTELLRAARLLPTLGPRLTGLGAPDGLEEELATALAEQRHQDALLTLVSDRILFALAAAGLRASPLKGPELGERLYGEPGRRQSSDIDLLLAAADLPAAVEVVRALGYEAPSDPVDAAGLPSLHLTMVHATGALPPVELHWRIHWYESRFSGERLLPPAPAPPREWSPRPEDELAALLLYYARDGFTGLRQATDLGAWWDRFGAALPPGALAAAAAAYPRLRPALTAAAATATRTVGLPPAISAGLALGGRGRVAAGLGTRPRFYGSREQLFAEIALVDGLLTPRGGFGEYRRRQILPGREVLRAQVEKAGPARAPSPWGHAARTVPRFALSLARLPRRRESSA